MIAFLYELWRLLTLKRNWKLITIINLGIRHIHDVTPYIMPYGTPYGAMSRHAIVRRWLKSRPGPIARLMAGSQLGALARKIILKGLCLGFRLLCSASCVISCHVKSTRCHTIVQYSVGLMRWDRLLLLLNWFVPPIIHPSIGAQNPQSPQC